MNTDQAISAVIGLTLVGLLSAVVVENTNKPTPVVVSPKATAAPTKSAPAKRTPKPSYVLKTKPIRSSFFWDDGSGINGDTGAPASGKPMQEGLFASPMWPLGTTVEVSARGRKVKGFIGDFGPGRPAQRAKRPVLIDLDTYSFRYLHDGKKPKSKYRAGVVAGHITVTVKVLKWGAGKSFKGRSKYWHFSKWGQR